MTYRVRLIVFSGTEDPIFEIKEEQISSLEALIETAQYSSKQPARVMGYQGFIVTSNQNMDIRHIIGAPQVEMFLLGIAKTYIQSNVYDHIAQVIFNEYEDDLSYNFNMKEDQIIPQKNRFLTQSCTDTPLRGPDTVPKYDPKTDNFGCYITEQWDNNCYNYGSDILTNTFAQPERGTQHKWVYNTCEDVTRAAISDGLISIGKEYPSAPAAEGHFLALLIWPDTNFHWVRLDSNGLWSHKPGGTAVKNKDNDRKDISNPSIQDFSPWTEFCGYFVVVPSKATIN